MRYPNLEAEMKRLDIGKAEIAELLGIHITGVYQMLNGNRVLPVSRARKIRDAFFPDMALDYLFEEAAAKRKSPQASADEEDEA